MPLVARREKNVVTREITREIQELTHIITVPTASCGDSTCTTFRHLTIHSNNTSESTTASTSTSSSSLSSSSSPAARTAPRYLPFLPLEIHLYILQYLALPDLVRCMSVNSIWQTIIVENSDLWRTIELTRPISPNSLQHYLQFAKRQPFRVSLKEYTSAWSLQCLTQDCVSLHTLDLSGSQFVLGQTFAKHFCHLRLQNLVLTRSRVDVATAMAIACLCPTLKYLNISHCYFSGELQNSDRLEPDFQQGHLLQMEHMDMGTCRLDTIDISGVYRISIHSFIWILCRCPNLENLRAYGSAVTLSAFLRACFIYCPNMLVIKYSPARETAVITHPTINQRGILIRGRDLYSMNASKLVSLVLHGTVINKPLMEFVIDQCYQTIESLQLSKNWMLQNDTLYYLAQRRPPRLRSLVLSSCANFQADALVYLIRACSHIQSLRLSRATAGVTDASLYEILDALPDLQYLNVAHCPRLSMDALQFLKNQAKVRRIRIVVQ